MTPEIERLLRERIVLDYAIERTKDDMSRAKSSITAGVIRICGSQAWRDRQQVNQGLWRERVNFIRKEGPLVHYSIKGKSRTLVVEDWQFVQAMDKYAEHAEREMNRKMNPGRT